MKSSLLITVTAFTLALSACSQSSSIDSKDGRTGDSESKVVAINTKQVGEQLVSNSDSQMDQVGSNVLHKIGNQVAPHTVSVLQGRLEVDKVKSNDKQTRFMFTLINPNDYAVSVKFNSGMTADLIAFDNKNQRKWAWGDNMMFTQALSQRRLKAKQQMPMGFNVPNEVIQALPVGSRLEVRLAGKVQEASKVTLHPVIIPII
ncbi:BsuPI-related putative proteinase inhibitor [Shewanella maritima]|uniref:BsuPI-related putative proteinase inhibitor n=1 Tax=Shewanella maritima TaxID=2520507 RepID=UPI0037354D92